MQPYRRSGVPTLYGNLDMFILWTLWLTAGSVGATQAGPGTVGNGPPESQGSVVAPAIAVKETVPVAVVFIEHQGPYWTVGPAFVRVRDYMLRHKQFGAMYVRYPQPPDRTGSEQFAEVGFIADGHHQPDAPFEEERRASELVAYLSVDGRSAVTRRDHARIRQWAEAHGHEPAGPITEVYLPAPRGKSGQTRTEIRISLRRPSPVGGDVLPGHSVESTDPGPSASDEARERPTRHEPNAEARQRLQADERVTVPTTAAATDLTIEVAPPLPVDQGSAPTAAGPAPTDESGTLEPIQSVAALIESARFDRIAEQLMPSNWKPSAAVRLWLGQVVFRIQAVAKGIDEVYPGEGRIALDLAGALRRRYRRVSVDLEQSPLDQAVVRVDVHGDPLATRRREIVADLDRLMGRIAFQAVNAEAATITGADIVQRVQDLSPKPGAAPPKDTLPDPK